MLVDSVLGLGIHSVGQFVRRVGHDRSKFRIDSENTYARGINRRRASQASPLLCLFS